MKTLRFTFLMMTFLSFCLLLSAQSGMTINSGGAVTVNGNTIITPVSFNCGEILTDNRDGKTYSTVQIGTQCWMSQNLNIGTRIDGTSEQTNNGIIEKYCYDNLQSNCDIYGGLYQWAELVQYLNGATNTTPWLPAPTGNVQGLCPNGWHLPTDPEWSVLSNFLGIYDACFAMKSTYGWSNNYNGSNSSGFNGLPSGIRDINFPTFNQMFDVTWYFGATDYQVYGYHASTVHILQWACQELGWTAKDKAFGASARCLKD